MSMFIEADNRVNYKSIAMIINLGNRPITTVDEYYEWVRDWKEIHSDLVTAIHHFRELKDVAKKQGRGTDVNIFWLRKKSLGRYARTMYELRNDRKSDFKLDKYKILEAA